MKFLTLKPLISKIIGYWKLISAVIGITGMLIVGKAKYDSWVIGKAEDKRIEVENWQKVDTVLYQFRQVKTDIGDIKTNIGTQSTNIDKNIKETEALKKGLVDYWRAKKEFDAVINFQQNLLDEIKKNE